MRMGFWRTVTTVLAIVCILWTPARPARADLADDLFGMVKDHLTGQLDPDQMEMLRYSVDNPFNGMVVYQRAAEQNYAFFALVGAVKAAKNKEFPGVGTFTQDVCMTPVTLIDEVFDDAAGYVSAGQGSTDAAVNEAQQIAAGLAQNASAEAKKEVMAQIVEAVPLFGDIPVICDFAFNTEFETEKNIQAVAEEKVRTVYAAYVDIQSGEVVAAVQKLISLGVDPAIACDLVDTAVTGGAIGKVPLLGNLAKGACASFAGTIFDGAGGLVSDVADAVYGFAGDAVSEGRKLVRDGGCAVISLFADFCDDTEEVPGPTPEQTAATAHAQLLADNQAWYQAKVPELVAAFDGRWLPRCVSSGCANDVSQIRQDALSQTQAAGASDDGNMPAKVIGIFGAADAVARVTVGEWDFKDGLPQLLNQFDAEFKDECEDEQCRVGLRIVRLNLQQAMLMMHAENPALPYGLLLGPPAQARMDAKALIAESAERIAAYNVQTTASASSAYLILNNAVWGKKCADAICMAEVATLAVAVQKATILLQETHPGVSSGQIQIQINQTYQPMFKALIDESTARAAKVIQGANAEREAARTLAAEAVERALADAPEAGRRAHRVRRVAASAPVRRARPVPPPVDRRVAPPPVVRRVPPPPPVDRRVAPSPVQRTVPLRRLPPPCEPGRRTAPDVAPVCTPPPLCEPGRRTPPTAEPVCTPPVARRR